MALKINLKQLAKSHLKKKWDSGYPQIPTINATIRISRAVLGWFKLILISTKKFEHSMMGNGSVFTQGFGLVYEFKMYFKFFRVDYKPKKQSFLAI